MMDPFFGAPLAGTPPWSAMPNMGFAWGQAPFAPNRQAVTGLEGLGPGTQGPAIGAQGPMGFGFATGPGIGLRSAPPMFLNSFAAPGALAGFVSPEWPIEVTGPALLAAVAQRRGQPQGPTTDREVEEFLYDVFDLLPGLTEVEVRCEGGRVTLTGSVQHKKLKRDAGEICWAVPAASDVHNNVTISPRRRPRGAQPGAHGGSAKEHG
jgi:hypothetical protein